MLVSETRFINTVVMGLQTGSPLARTKSPVINPRTLEILAYEVVGQLLDTNPSLLRIADIREFSSIGIIIDSSEELVSPDDVIKLGEVYDLHFTPINMPVIDKKGHRLGKVTGYTVDTGNFVIQQLKVKRPFYKSLNDTELLVHRSQITEINDKAIVVQSETQPPDPIMSSVKAAYINPFRKTERARAELNTTSRE